MTRIMPLIFLALVLLPQWSFAKIIGDGRAWYDSVAELMQDNSVPFGMVHRYHSGEMDTWERYDGKYFLFTEFSGGGQDSCFIGNPNKMTVVNTPGIITYTNPPNFLKSEMEVKVTEDSIRYVTVTTWTYFVRDQLDTKPNRMERSRAITISRCKP